MSNFHKVNQGVQGEQRILDLLNSSGINSVKIDGYKKEYDLECKYKELDFTCEIKSDLMGKKTGNIALEFWNSRRNEPSGVTATTAIIWFHIFCDEIWVANVLELRLFIQNNKPDKIIFSGGDSNANLYIYKATRILPTVFTRVDEFNAEKVRNTILGLTRE